MHDKETVKNVSTEMRHRVLKVALQNMHVLYFETTHVSANSLLQYPLCGVK